MRERLRHSQSQRLGPEFAPNAVDVATCLVGHDLAKCNAMRVHKEAPSTPTQNPTNLTRKLSAAQCGLLHCAMQCDARLVGGMLRIVVVAEADIAHLPHDFIKHKQQQQQSGAGLAGPAALLPATCSPELLLPLQPAAHIAAVLVAAGAVAAAATAVALGQSRSQSVQTQSPIA